MGISGSKSQPINGVLKNLNKTNPSQSINISTWNIKRGLLKRELEIINLLKEEKLAILFLTETDVVMTKQYIIEPNQKTGKTICKRVTDINIELQSVPLSP